MPGADAPTPPDDRLGLEALDALADAVLLRLDRVLAERVESLSAQADESPEPGWLRVSEVARRVGANERTVFRALRSGALAGERLGAHCGSGRSRSKRGSRLPARSGRHRSAALRERPPPAASAGRRRNHGPSRRAQGSGRSRGRAPFPQSTVRKGRPRRSDETK